MIKQICAHTYRCMRTSQRMSVRVVLSIVFVYLSADKTEPLTTTTTTPTAATVQSMCHELSIATITLTISSSTLLSQATSEIFKRFYLRLSLSLSLSPSHNHSLAVYCSLQLVLACERKKQTLLFFQRFYIHILALIVVSFVVRWCVLFYVLAHLNESNRISCRLCLRMGCKNLFGVYE